MILRFARGRAAFRMSAFGAKTLCLGLAREERARPRGASGGSIWDESKPLPAGYSQHPQGWSEPGCGFLRRGDDDLGDQRFQALGDLGRDALQDPGAG